MIQTASENITEARWVSQHWWSTRFYLKSNDGMIASVCINGSRGTAAISDRQYALERFRLPPFITIRDIGTDELVARFCLLPKQGYQGLLVEFDDGDSFHFGWVSWWKREWAWTTNSGDTVLSSQRSWLGHRIGLHVEQATNTKWPMLAVLELAMAKLALTWF